MPTEAPPLLVVEDSDSLTRAAARLEMAGWRLRDGFELGERTWDLRGLHLVCVGDIRSEGDASAALLAASRGTGLVTRLHLAPREAGRFLEDLRHIGPVELLTPRSDMLTLLEDEERRALEILAAGGSLEDVASELGYSRRTVSRKLAAARATLGVKSTTEAVLAVAKRRP
jgi:DNA-binding NarL/FixJ family response regulator